MQTKSILSLLIATITIVLTSAGSCNSDDPYSGMYESCTPSFEYDSWHRPHWMKRLIDKGDIKKFYQIELVEEYKVFYVAEYTEEFTAHHQQYNNSNLSHGRYSCYQDSDVEVMGSHTPRSLEQGGYMGQNASTSEILEHFGGDNIRLIWED